MSHHLIEKFVIASIEEKFFGEEIISLNLTEKN